MGVFATYARPTCPHTLAHSRARVLTPEPMPPGTTPEERAEALKMVQMQKYFGYGMESCVFKSTMAGVVGCVFFPSLLPFLLRTT